MDIIHILEKLHHHFFSLLLILCFLGLLYKWLLPITNATTKHNPPSPPKLPILGNLHQLGKLPHHSLRSLSKQYGDLMLLHLGNKPTLVASSAAAAQPLLKTHDVVFANRPKTKVACKITYENKGLVFTDYGEYWRQMKSLCMVHVLSSTKVKTFRKVREEEAAEMVKQMRISEEVNLSESFVRMTNDVICRATFGKKCSGEEGCVNIREILGDLSVVLGAFCIEDCIPWLGWIDWVTGVERKANRAFNVLDKFLETRVQEHQQGSVSQTDDAGAKVQDFVDILLEIQRENSDVLPRETIKAILLDLLAAGTETTYTLLEWAMTELLRHPRVMKELQTELRGSIRGKTRVEEDDLKNLKYLKAVIKETLRLHPVLPLLLFHQSSQDIKVNGYDICAGTQVIINAWAIQRDSAYWEEAEEFRPERFLNSSVDFKGQHFEFIPFGAGRRGCPGMAFAIVDAELILATLAYEFDWKLPHGQAQDFDVAETAGLSTRKRDPLVAIPILHSTKQKQYLVPY